jgi:hypothetical protein
MSVHENSMGKKANGAGRTSIQHLLHRLYQLYCRYQVLTRAAEKSGNILQTTFHFGASMFKAGENCKESADSRSLGMNPGELRLLEGAKPGPAGVRSRTLLRMVATALAIRLIVMAFMYPQHLVPFHDHFHFGF